MLYEHPHMKVVRMEALVELIGQRIAAVSARLADERATPEPDAALLTQLDQQCVDMTKEQLALNPDDEAVLEMTRRRYQ
jgi:hypothetical protein